MLNSTIRRLQIVIENEILVFENLAVLTEDKCGCVKVKVNACAGLVGIPTEANQYSNH